MFSLRNLKFYAFSISNFIILLEHSVNPRMAKVRLKIYFKLKFLKAVFLTLSHIFKTSEVMTAFH